jgi:hypothetical protein
MRYRHRNTLNFNPLNAELNPICHLLASLGAHPILHISRIRVNHLLHQDVWCCVCLLNVLLALHVLVTLFISVDVIHLCDTYR